MVDIEKTPFQHQSQPFFEPPRESSFPVGEPVPGIGERARIRAKSAQRLRYEAEIGVLKRKLGDLESIRNQLGLSQRKICQLLFVDPSAWTRWAKSGESAPPHIYRALQWYLALQDKYPALDVNFWLSTAPRAQAPEAIDAAWESTAAEIATLKSEVTALQARCDQLAYSQSPVLPAPGLDPRRAFILGFFVATAILSLGLVVYVLLS